MISHPLHFLAFPGLDFLIRRQGPNTATSRVERRSEPLTIPSTAGRLSSIFEEGCQNVKARLFSSAVRSESLSPQQTLASNSATPTRPVHAAAAVHSACNSTRSCALHEGVRISLQWQAASTLGVSTCRVACSIPNRACRSCSVCIRKVSEDWDATTR